MKKLALVLMAVAALGSMSFAQKGAMSLGGDVGLFMPTGDMSDWYSMGFGFCPVFKYMLNDKLGITGTTGYVMWSAKEEIMGIEYSASDIPIKGGVKYYFGAAKMKPYVQGEFGLHMVSAKAEGSYSIMGYTYTIDESASETEMGFSFGGGFEMPMGEKMNLNLLAQYESIMEEESFNNIVIKAGLVFNLK